ncbi:hypothetical protein [Oerskovia sp. KBS0722]|uniref:hypothetical protein n=1 Tax=Oerskovia sp. KBS0722 TaxID=1179673 RepID=UPI00110E7D32|nr:hypothetical protein [Oerskovia sp. KBS0722]QDW62725.1 hypothetical protein FFI11_009350 [Oerskovia sp. KBS0722]
MNLPSSTRPYGLGCTRRAPARAVVLAFLGGPQQALVDALPDAGVVGFSYPDDALQSIATALNADFPTVESATLKNPAYTAPHQRELATATADRACRTEIDDDTQQQVRHDLEADFLAENREVVEQAVAQSETVSGRTSAP